MFVENQQVVQYRFQRLKLIWNPQTGRITVGNIGDIYVNAHRSSFPPAFWSRSTATTGKVLELRMAIGLTQSVARVGQGQGITVAVDARE